MGLFRKTASMATFGYVAWTPAGAARRHAAKTRRTVAVNQARQTHLAAQVAGAQIMAAQQQAAVAAQQQQIAYQQWMDQQARQNPYPGWYPDPSGLATCWCCGAPRDGVAPHESCRYCSHGPKWRWYDGTDWTDRVRN